MRRIIGLWVLVFAVFIFIISAVSEFTFFFFQLRLSPKALNSWWGSDKGGSGDLYGLTSLPQFRNTNPAEKQYAVKAPNCTADAKSYNIYALSDSYTEGIFSNPKNFCGADQSDFVSFSNRNILPVYLEKTKKNILVIECVERDVRTNLANTDYLLHFLQISKEKLNDEPAGGNKHRFHFNFKIKNADADYESNLWDYRFLRPLKKLKAKMYFNWFNRTYRDAVVSPDGKYLLYEPTVDTASVHCSYRPISNQEINGLINGLNQVYDHYKKAGFEEIYLSIIPNPVTVLYPDYKGLQYNQLIPKIENDPYLKLKVFDTYRLFKNSAEKDKIYQRADTHWTAFGSQLWLDEFNKQLALQKF